MEATSIILRNELLATERFLTVVVSFSLLLPRKHPVLKALPVKLPNIRQPVGITTFLKNRSLSPVAQMFIGSRSRISETACEQSIAQGLYFFIKAPGLKAAGFECAVCAAIWH